MMLEILIYFLFGALFFVAFLELVRSYCHEGDVKSKLKWFVVIVKENMKPADMAAKDTPQQREHTPQIV